MELWHSLVIGVLFGLSFFLLLQRSMSRILLGLLVLSNASNLLIFVAPGLTRALSPIMEGDTLKGQPHADPLPQALILTAIVIGMGILAFALALSMKIKKDLGIEDVDEMVDEE